jgi:glycosyltransferase involved in cell wall biosynthesis
MGGFDGLMCLTTAAERHYRAAHPKMVVRKVDWCADHRYRPASPGPRGGYALCAGRTNRDYATLLEAAHMVRGRLRLICPPEAIASLKLAPNVDFIASSSPTASHTVSYRKLMEEHFAGAACIVVPVVPAPWETAGLTNLLEALHMGKASITTRTGCLDLDVEKEGVGLTVPPRDARALADAINRMLEQPSSASEMGEKALRLADAQFGWTAFGQAVEAVLRDVMQQG